MRERTLQPNPTRRTMDLPLNRVHITGITRAPFYHPDSIENYINDIKAMIDFCPVFDYVYTKYRVKCESRGETVYEKAIFRDYLRYFGFHFEDDEYGTTIYYSDYDQDTQRLMIESIPDEL